MGMAHSKLGASGAHRWMVCPGSIAMSEGMPNESSIHAMHGSAAHALCEFILLNPSEKPEDYRGHFINGEGEFFKPGDDAKTEDAFEIDDEMCDGVNLYVETVMRDYEENALIQDVFLYVEESFDLSFVRPNMFGTNDASVFCPGDFLIVSDFKYGRGKVVEVEENEQGMYYALGAIRKLCYDADLGDYDPGRLPKTVTIQIIQPRAMHHDGPVRSWTVPVERIIVDFFAELKKAADATSVPNALLRAGDHCFFCPGKPVCPELKEEAQRALQTDFGDLDDDLDEEDLADMGKSKARAISSDARAVADALKALPMIEAYAKAIDGYATTMARGGETIPGYKLVRKGTKRRWTDKDDAKESLAKYLDEEEYLGERPLLSYTKIEKIKKEVEIEVDGEPQTVTIRQIVADLVHKPEGGLTLAPESDTRKEIRPEPGKDFEDLDEDGD